MAEGRDEKGAFALGNDIWTTRMRAGRFPKFENDEQLRAACLEYFQWNADNPLYEAKLTSFQGVNTIEHLPKIRAMTISALCLHIGITLRQWTEWRKSRADLLPIITQAEEIIRTQKFEGAAADLLNANIIARDLGLADKAELSGPDGGPIKTETSMNDKELARQVAFLLAKATQGE